MELRYGDVLLLGANSAVGPFVGANDPYALRRIVSQARLLNGKVVVWLVDGTGQPSLTLEPTLPLEVYR